MIKKLLSRLFEEPHETHARKEDKKIARNPYAGFFETWEIKGYHAFTPSGKYCILFDNSTNFIKDVSSSSLYGVPIAQQELAKDLSCPDRTFLYEAFFHEKRKRDRANAVIAREKLMRLIDEQNRAKKEVSVVYDPLA